MKFKSFLAVILAELIAFSGMSVPISTPVHAQATLLAPGKQCFQATTGLSGMIGTIGAITPGSGYVNGSYGGVPLTGGSGTNGTANITVSGGIVSSVTILNPGVQFVVGDVLSAASATIGGSGSGFSFPVASTSINSSLAGGTVAYYIPSTLTTKQTWQDSGETILNQNPVPLDTNGCAIVYGSGTYRQIVKDNLNDTIWDVVTSSAGGSSGGGTASTQGVMVGTIMGWVNTTLPPLYLYTAGQAVSRTTFPQLLTALTYQQNILCLTGIATIAVSTAISDSVPIGAPVEVSCFAPGTTVQSKISGQLTLSSNATATVSTSMVIFPWGNGDGSTTFNVPDLRGRVIAGRDNMNGSVAGRLTTQWYAPSGAVSPDGVNAAGGNQTFTILTPNLPAYIPSGTVGPPTVNALGGNQAISAANGSVTFGAAATGATNTYAAAQMGTVQSGAFTGAPQGGIDTPFSLVQPSLTADYIIKALPDSSPTGPGVSSIGGMTGVIACSGNSLICNANTLSVTLTVTINSLPISGGTLNGLLFNNAGTVGNTNSANGGLANTGSSGIPAITQTPTLSNTAAPSSPASGSVTFWADSTDLRLHDKNSAGAIGTTAVGINVVAHQWLNGMNANGTFAASQPAFTDISGAIAPATQLPNPLTIANTVAPSSPAAGNVTVWTDSTDLRLHDKNSAGAIGTTAVAASIVTHQFFNGMNANGTFTAAQPAFADISGQNTLAQLPNLGANSIYLNATAGSSVPTSFTAPACAADGEHGWTYTNGTGVLCTTHSGAQLPGTATNDNANSGNVGEYIFSNLVVGSAVAATSNTPVDVTTISLPAGDWNVWGNVYTSVVTGPITSLEAGITQTLNTLGTRPNNGMQNLANATLAASANESISAGFGRISLSGTTTIHLVANVVYTAGSCGLFGFLGARRAR